MTTFKAKFLNDNAEYKAKFENVIVVHDGYVPPYTGDYNVVPEFDVQTLETKNKKMAEDVTVEAIPVAEVSNPSGGTTITIG